MSSNADQREYREGAALGCAERAVMTAGWLAVEDQLDWCEFPQPDQVP